MVIAVRSTVLGTSEQNIAVSHPLGENETNRLEVPMGSYKAWKLRKINRWSSESNIAQLDV